MKYYICIERNYYHDTCDSVEIHDKIFVGKNSIKEAKKYFDGLHECEKDENDDICNYCEEKWEKNDGGYMKSVDYDGALVTYEIMEVKEAK